MKGMKDKQNRRHGTTVVELAVAVAILAVVFAAVVPLFAGIRNSTETRWAGLEIVQNARVLNDQLYRHLTQAKRVVSVSGASEGQGYIVFETVGGAVLRYEVGAGGYVQYGPAGSPARLAGPVTSLKFVCYDVNDPSRPTETATDVRLVTWEASFDSSAPLMRDRTIAGAAFLRANANIVWNTATTTYDSACRPPEAEVLAFAGEGSPRIPAEPGAPAVGLTSEQYDAIAMADGELHGLEATSEADFVQLRYAVLVDGDGRDVLRITATWTGRGIKDHPLREDGASLYIWNYSAGVYELLAASEDTESEVTVTGSANGRAVDYIGGPDENTVTLFVALNDKNTGQQAGRLLTDHVKVDVASRVESGPPRP